MIAINYMVLFLLMAVVLFAAIFLTVGLPWFGLSGYGEVLSCCSRYRANGCDSTDIRCDGEYLGSLMTEQNITETQLKSMCNCEQRT